MKKVIIIVIAILILIAISVTALPASATDTTDEGVVTETAEDTTGEGVVTETAEDTELIDNSETYLEIQSEEAEEIVSVIEQSGSKAEAILSLAERLGITTEEAEALINAVIDVGDEYLGETTWWVGFKNDVQQDIQFWTTAIVLICAVLAIVGGVFVLLAKTNPTMKKAMWGMTESLKLNDQIKTENSQTLGDLKQIFTEAAKKEELFEEVIKQKEEYIEQLTEKIERLEAASAEERVNMVKAEIYNLRMLKLVCDRTAMPITDKATIDLFYAKGIDALKAELSPEDIEKIEKTMSGLDSVGGDQV